MDVDETLTRLEKLEDAFISSIREVRSIKAEIQKRVSENSTLEPLLEAEDVAKILGVEIDYVYSLARNKKIPSIKIGKYRKFSPVHLQKWLERKNS